MKKIQPAKPLLPILEDGYLDIEEEAIYEGQHFLDQDLSYSTGKNLALRGCRLENVTLDRSRLERFECSNVVFSHCNLSNVEWLGGSFHQVHFDNCKLTGTNFAESYLRDCRFSDCLGDFSSFSSTNLKVVFFEHCRLSQSEFFEVNWQHLQLDHCDLNDANWFRTKLKDLDLRSCTFDKIAFSEELLRGLKVNQEQAITIAAALGLIIED